MSDERHLSHAPITEALIDFRVRLPADVTTQDLDQLVQVMDDRYYRKAPIVRGLLSFSVAPEQPAAAQATSTVIGVRLHSRDDRYVVQLSLEGFTISRLAPYETWHKLRDEARRIWELCIARLAPEIVTRAATRYINNLRLPLRHGDRLSEYLACPPQVPSGVPDSISSFLQRVVIHDPASDAVIIVTQMLEHSSVQPPVPVILDVDASREAEFAPSGEGLWQCLETLRRLKNKFFFASLTDTTLRVYQ